jgi:hypothetical protein
VFETNCLELAAFECADKVIHVANVRAELGCKTTDVADNMGVTAADTEITQVLRIVDGDLFLIITTTTIENLDNLDP